MAGAAGSLPELVGAVDLPVRDPQRQQDRHHHGVVPRPGRGFVPPPAGGVVAARSHLQVPADELDSELLAVLVDELDDHFDGRRAPPCSYVKRFVTPHREVRVRRC
jgi:hypothetical protein